MGFTIGLVGQQLEMKMFATLCFSNFFVVLVLVVLSFPSQEVWFCVVSEGDRPMDHGGQGT